MSAIPSPHPLWYICLIVRFLFGVLVARGINITGIQKKTMCNFTTCVLLIMGTGFAYQWFNHNPNKHEFQIARVWWNSDRPVHAVVFLLAAVYHYNGSSRTAGALLIADAAFSVANRWM